MKAIKFKNFTDDVFVWDWDKVSYTFLPRTETYMEDFKARHFAKHLVDRELNKRGQLTNYIPARNELLALALPEDEVEVSMEQAVDIEARKAVTPKKKVVEEEEFPELKKKGKK